MRKTAFAAALALAMALPGGAMAGDRDFGQHSALHLSGVKLQFHFGQAHHRFFGAPKHRFHGKFHRPHFRGHKRFFVPHHPGFRHGFLGRPHHSFKHKHLHRGFVAPKIWKFKRHGHGHFKHRSLKHPGLKHRAFKHPGVKHRSFKGRRLRHWRH